MQISGERPIVVIECAKTGYVDGMREGSPGAAIRCMQGRPEQQTETCAKRFKAAPTNERELRLHPSMLRDPGMAANSEGAGRYARPLEENRFE